MLNCFTVADLPATVILNKTLFQIDENKLSCNGKTVFIYCSPVKSVAVNENVVCIFTKSGIMYFFNGKDVNTVDYNNKFNKNYIIKDMTLYNNCFVFSAYLPQVNNFLLFTQQGNAFSERRVELVKNPCCGGENILRTPILCLHYLREDGVLFCGFEKGFLMLISDCAECNVLKKICNFDIINIHSLNGELILTDGKNKEIISLKLFINETLSPYFIIKYIKEGAKIIDLRKRDKYIISHIKNAVNIDYDNLLNKIEKNNKDEKLLFHCESGLLACVATDRAKNAGFTNSYNIGSYLCFKDFIKECNLKNEDYIVCGGGEKY